MRMNELSVIILAVATVVLAYATWRMASVSKKAFELETQPYFAFKNFLFKVFVDPSDKNDGLEKTHLKIGIIFRNPGKVLIRYEVKSLRLTFGGQTIDNPQFATRGGSIYPEEEALFWYGTIPNVDMSALPRTGSLEYVVEYSDALEQGTVTTTKRVQYTIHSLKPVDFDWIYQHEEDP